MRCKKCDYRLWNLRSRQCPECNTPFKPSDFEFALNSVRFACPHCGQCYYGTGDKGHLSPIEFDCVRCGRHIHMDETVLLPTVGVEEEQTAPAAMPWLDRSRRGFFRAWLGTIWMAMIRPGQLIGVVPLESSLLDAWWFAVLTQLTIALVCMGPMFLFMVVVSSAGEGAGWAGAGLGFGAAFAVILAGTVAGIALWGAITHGVLCVGAQPRAGLRRTYHALCYSAGANVLSAIPCFGYYIGWVWWLVSAVLMVRDGQRVTGLRASVAVLLTPCLGILAVIGFYTWLFVAVLPRSGAFLAMSQVQASSQAQVVAVTVRAYARLHNGRAFTHAAELLADGFIQPASLLAPGSGTTLAHIPVGSLTLQRFSELDRQEKLARVQEAIGDLPDGVVAQRLGDFVFTCNRLDLDAVDPAVWTFIMWADPASNDPPASTDVIYIGLADGTVLRITVADLDAELAGQNSLRAEAGLPPLPHPEEVTHDAPAVAAAREAGVGGRAN